MTPGSAGRPPPRARQARRTRWSSGRWPSCRAWYMACTSGPKDPQAAPPGHLGCRPAARAPDDPHAPGQLYPLADRRRRRPRRTPGRRVRSPRCGWWRTRLRSARTPTCRWNGSPAPGPRLLQAVPRSPPQPRPPPGRDIGPEHAVHRRRPGRRADPAGLWLASVLCRPVAHAGNGTRNTPQGSGARWPWFEIRQLTDVFHCNLQHHLSCNRLQQFSTSLGPSPGAAAQSDQCSPGLVRTGR